MCANRNDLRELRNRSSVGSERLSKLTLHFVSTPTSSSTYIRRKLTALISTMLVTPLASESGDTPTTLEYSITHVFLPVNLPRKSDYTPENDHALALAVCAAAHTYTSRVCGTSEQAQWQSITKMLDNLQEFVQLEHIDPDRLDHVISQLRGMQTGGTFPIFL